MTTRGHGRPEYHPAGHTDQGDRVPTKPDVVGAAEAAKLLGVELQRISRWVRTGRLPPPWSKPKCGPAWYRKDIEHVRDYGEWPPNYAPPETMPWLSTLEVAAWLRVDKSQVSRWRRRPNKSGPVFPTPFDEMAAGPLWLRADIERFDGERAEAALAAA